jgi:hypothetical protein
MQSSYISCNICDAMKGQVCRSIYIIVDSHLDCY